MSEDRSLTAYLDAVIVDIGGTLVAEAPPGTPTTDLRVTLLPEVAHDLAVLARSVRLAAATNTAVMSERDVRSLLATVGVCDLLEVVVTSADVGAAKPDPRTLHVALERMGGIRPDRALYVGDLPTDEQAARSAGMHFAGVHPNGLLAAVRQWAADQTQDPGRRWRRPVPLIGDTTSAAERAAEPDAWALSAEARRGLYEAIHSRRDIRRFRPNPIDDDIIRRILEAAHSAPSVGHSQPWRFIIVTDDSTRARAAWLADQERLAQAAVLSPEAGRHLLDLQLEGIREAPFGIVVCCDRRAPAAGILGQRTLQDADIWSCACAIENLWLSSRAEGLGVGWVTLFRPEDLSELLGLPDQVVPLGWLCVGWPDERQPEPGLQRAGWSTRLALDEVVVHEHWAGQSLVAPKPPRSKLRSPDQQETVSARDRADELLTPLGSLGKLDRSMDRIVALGGAGIDGGTLVLAAGRHPVDQLGVSAFAREVTDEVLDAARAGRALGVVAARGAGLGVDIIDGGSSAGNLRDEDALAPARVGQLIDRGVEAGRRAATRGIVVLGELGVGNTTVAAALTAAVLDMGAADVVGRGAGANSAMLEQKRAVITRALLRSGQLHGPAPVDPETVLASLGGPEFAILAGVCIGATEAGAPVVLDGLATSIAALIAALIEPVVATHLVAGQLSREHAHAAVLERLGLEPVLDLGFFSGEGVGASLATHLLLLGLRFRSLAARTA